MTKLQYLSSLRGKLLNLIENIEDAYPRDKFHSGRVTICNSNIRNTLNKTFEDYSDRGRAYGVYIGKRHVNCDNPKHKYDEFEIIGGRKINAESIYNNERFSLGWPIYEDEIKCICPCSAENRASEHSVIIDILFDKKLNTFPCDTIRKLFIEIYTALNLKDNQPRSDTREHLLKAVLVINDLILPIPMKEYIDEQLKKEKGP